MSRNGAGVYSLPAGNPVVTLTAISTSWANTTLSDLGNEISNSIDKGGRTTATADLPMGGFKHTGVAAAGSAGEYLVWGQAGSLGISAFPLGAVATPSVAFQGDLNTGMWSPGADTLAWSTGGVERMRIMAAGDFGFGTAAPSAAAGYTFNRTGAVNVGVEAVVSGVGSLAMGFNNSGATNVWGGPTAAAYVGIANAFPLVFATSGAERMRIGASTGNLLIGRTADVGGQNFLQVGANTAAARTLLSSNDAYALNLNGGGAGNYILGASTAAAPDLIVSNSIGTQRLRLTDDGRLFGSALHNNAGAVTGTTNQYIASGTYTPTVANVSNSGTFTASTCQWLRVGNVVTVSGRVQFASSAPGLTEVSMTLPIASALTSSEQLAGTAVESTVNEPAAAVLGYAAGDAALIQFIAFTSGTPFIWYFTYTYVVL